MLHADNQKRVVTKVAFVCIYYVLIRVWSKGNHNYSVSIGVLVCCLRSVVVITCASHAQGPQFDPGRRHIFFFCLCIYFMKLFTVKFLLPFYCRKGEAVFRSDNMSTISVLKEVLSKETTQRKTQVKFSHGKAIMTRFVKVFGFY